MNKSKTVRYVRGIIIYVLSDHENTQIIVYEGRGGLDVSDLARSPHEAVRLTQVDDLVDQIVLEAQQNPDWAMAFARGEQRDVLHWCAHSPPHNVLGRLQHDPQSLDDYVRDYVWQHNRYHYGRQDLMQLVVVHIKEGQSHIHIATALVEPDGKHRVVSVRKDWPVNEALRVRTAVEHGWELVDNVHAERTLALLRQHDPQCVEPYIEHVSGAINRYAAQRPEIRHPDVAGLSAEARADAIVSYYAEHVVPYVRSGEEHAALSKAWDKLSQGKGTGGEVLTGRDALVALREEGFDLSEGSTRPLFVYDAYLDDGGRQRSATRPLGKVYATGYHKEHGRFPSGEEQEAWEQRVIEGLDLKPIDKVRRERDLELDARMRAGEELEQAEERVRRGKGAIRSEKEFAHGKRGQRREVIEGRISDMRREMEGAIEVRKLARDEKTRTSKIRVDSPITANDHVALEKPVKRVREDRQGYEVSRRKMGDPTHWAHQTDDDAARVVAEGLYSRNRFAEDVVVSRGSSSTRQAEFVGALVRQGVPPDRIEGYRDDQTMRPVLDRAWEQSGQANLERIDEEHARRSLPADDLDTRPPETSAADAAEQATPAHVDEPGAGAAPETPVRAPGQEGSEGKREPEAEAADATQQSTGANPEAASSPLDQPSAEPAAVADPEAAESGRDTSEPAPEQPANSGERAGANLQTPNSATTSGEGDRNPPANPIDQAPGDQPARLPEDPPASAPAKYPTEAAAGTPSDHSPAVGTKRTSHGASAAPLSVDAPLSPQPPTAAKKSLASSEPGNLAGGAPVGQTARGIDAVSALRDLDYHVEAARFWGQQTGRAYLSGHEEPARNALARHVLDREPWKLGADERPHYEQVAAQFTAEVTPEHTEQFVGALACDADAANAGMRRLVTDLKRIEEGGNPNPAAFRSDPKQKMPFAPLRPAATEPSSLVRAADQDMVAEVARRFEQAIAENVAFAPNLTNTQLPHPADRIRVMGEFLDQAEACPEPLQRLASFARSHSPIPGGMTLEEFVDEVDRYVNPRPEEIEQKLQAVEAAFRELEAAADEIDRADPTIKAKVEATSRGKDDVLGRRNTMSMETAAGRHFDTFDKAAANNSDLALARDRFSEALAEAERASGDLQSTLKRSAKTERTGRKPYEALSSSQQARLSTASDGLHRKTSWVPAAKSTAPKASRGYPTAQTGLQQAMRQSGMIPPYRTTSGQMGASTKKGGKSQWPGLEQGPSFGGNSSKGGASRSGGSRARDAKRSSGRSSRRGKKG